MNFFKKLFSEEDQVKVIEPVDPNSIKKLRTKGIIEKINQELKDGRFNIYIMEAIHSETVIEIVSLFESKGWNIQINAAQEGHQPF